MKKYFPIIVIGLILITMKVTCPSNAAHIDAVSESYTKKGIVLKLIGKERIKFVIDKFVNVDNYVFISVGSYMLNDDKNIVSFGVFGHVFTYTKEDFWEELQRVL